MTWLISLCILLVIVGIGYVATAIAYGMGYEEGKQDGAIERMNDMLNQGYVIPPM